MSAPPKISHRVPLGPYCFIPEDLLLGEEDRRREENAMAREDRNPPPVVCGGRNIAGGSFIFLEEGDRPVEEIATARGHLGESGGGDEGAPSVGVVTEGGAAGTSDCGGRQSGGGAGSAGMDRAKQPSAIRKNRKMRSPPSAKSGAAKCCTDCGATQSWMWRGGPDGPKTLCSACGIYGEAKGQESPLEEFLRKMRAKAAKSEAGVSDEVVEAAAILMAISSAHILCNHKRRHPRKNHSRNC